MSRLRTHAAVVALLGALALAPAARAQEGTPIAEQLFRDGRSLLDMGKIDEACEKFASSERLAPAIGTRLNLALCRERQGRTASAWSLYTDVEAEAQRAGDTARARFAHEHGAALVSQLKKVVIEVPSPPPGMVMQLDSTVLPAGVLGTEIPLDPGDHKLTVTAPGKKPWVQSRLSLGPSATTVHVRVELEDEGPPAVSPSPVSARPTVSDPTPGSVAPEQPASPGDRSTRRIYGYAVGGAGIVLLGIAASYGLTAIARKNDEQNYPAGSQNRLTVYDQAKDAQTYGIIFGGLGAAAVGTGLFLVLTAHGSSVSSAPSTALRVVPVLGPTGYGVSLHASFF
jgi:hypothetical protein